MFNDTGMLTSCVEGAVVAVAGCKAGKWTEMALQEPCGLCSEFGVLSSV